MRKVMEHIDTCKECGSKELTWMPSLRNGGGVVDGRLRMSEISCAFILGCDECSETLQVVTADYIASVMTEELR